MAPPGRRGTRRGSRRFLGMTPGEVRSGQVKQGQERPAGCVPNYLIVCVFEGAFFGNLRLFFTCLVVLPEMPLIWAMFFASGCACCVP